MNGFEAISYYNGWAQAVAGALIVMSGLSILALVISQLHKVIYFVENFGKKPMPEHEHEHEDEASVCALPDLLNVDTCQLCDLSRPYVEKLGESFQLSDLYDVFMQNSLPHPHLTIRALRESGKIVPLGEGVFCWHR